MCLCCVGFFCQAEDGIRDLVRSRGLGDVYKRQYEKFAKAGGLLRYGIPDFKMEKKIIDRRVAQMEGCLLYTSDAADERSSVDLGGRRIIKKKKKSKGGRWRRKN